MLTAGAPLKAAEAALVLIHGRGATAESMLPLTEAIGHPGIAYLAPQAADNTWYPHSFLRPLPENEPYLSSALAFVGDVLTRVAAAGVPLQRTVLLGFSQGACLALEYAARHARRYGGLVGLSGGLIGPDGTPREYQGSLDRTTVFLGCSDVDSHVPKERVLESAAVLRRLGGEVTARLYPGMGHTINAEEIAFVAGLTRSLVVPREQ